MRLFVLGATGGIGRELIRQSRERGNRITAFVRSPQKLVERDDLIVRGGNPLSADALQAALPGHDAVISALGPPGPGPTTVLRDGARSAIAAMQVVGVRRLLIVSAAMLFDDAGFLAHVLRRTLLRNVARDCAAMEALVTASGLDWTLLRPPRLTNGPLTRRYQLADGSMPPGRLVVSRADVADCLLDELEGGEHLRRIVGMAGGSR